jgi:eukaryotic-like serine/threonine-protein kinase
MGFVVLKLIRSKLRANGKCHCAEIIQVQKTKAGYELGTVGKAAFYPVYVRGEAFLVSRRPKEAAAEFQKILDHPGIALSSPIGIRGRIGLARANAMQGDSAKTKLVYQDFFALWKDADPDIPILKQAKAEYAKLQ